MLTRAIPGSGEALPVIGLGSWQTFDVGRSDAERAAPQSVLAHFHQAGGRLVDSSPMYGQAESVIGACADRLGLLDKLFMATKVWTTGKREGSRQLEESLRRLRTPKLDLIQVHNLLDVETHLETLSEWRAQGRVRYVGITHYHAGAHEALAKVLRTLKVDFVQVNYSLAEREAERLIFPLAAERGVAVIVNRPFAEGALLRRLKNRALPDLARDLQCTSWARLALKFILAQPAVTCVIPATSNPSHLSDFVAAGSGPLPDSKQLAALVAAAS